MLPLYVFVPVNVSVPLPLFVNEPEPLITPAIVVLVASPTVGNAIAYP